MQTLLSAEFADSLRGQEAEGILRNCVHCGFCNATCPTYQLLGDELDGPRGRIYQMKLVFEGAEPTIKMQQHLDRCLTCRSCETTCPSGVQYSKLLEIGREVVEQKVPRKLKDKWLRKLLTAVIPRRPLFTSLLKIGQSVKALVPAAIAAKIPESENLGKWPPITSFHPRKMVVLAGCAQPSLTPNTNMAATRVLDKMGVSLIEEPKASCCGAVGLHTSSQQQGKELARNLIDAWYPYLEQGVEAFVVTASGCGVTVKEYPHLFKDDPEYLGKANRICERTYDLCEVIEKQLQSGGIQRSQTDQYKRVAFHSPCTLQHGQRIKGKIEGILEAAGYELCEIQDSHLCCGSAGTYSLLQPEISERLRKNKQQALGMDQPDVICTANVGCQSSLSIDSNVPVVHWVELLV